jgi:DNA (cytosine-5)-methyltransferase 1
MYKKHFSNEDIYKTKSIKVVEPSEVPSVSLWWASFPCTDVSLAGYRQGLKGEQTGALLAFLELLQKKDGQRPALVLLENVSGFVSSHKGEDFASIIWQLNSLGYTCDSFMLDAKHFVPQSRPRLFIVGVYDHPTSKDVTASLVRRDESLKSRQLTDFITRHADLSWFIQDIPSPVQFTPSLALVIDDLSDESQRWWSKERTEYLLEQMSPRHKQVLQTLLNMPGRQCGTAYRRMRNGKSMAELRVDNIAGCLRTPRGGSSRQILVLTENGEIRARYMTPREYAKLMGANEFVMDGISDNQAYFGFGDAVCVPVVAWIAKHVLEPLVSEQTKTDLPDQSARRLLDSVATLHSRA